MKKDMFADIPDIVRALQRGECIVLVDDARRENEGDLVAPAQSITAEQINFMVTHGRGILCLTMTGEDTQRLQLHPIVTDATDSYQTAWHTPIDLCKGISTGTSAQDRAATIAVASDPRSKAEDFICGHVSTLRSQNGGTLVRAGHTEGSTDLMQLAGLQKSAVICEIMKENGEMARMPELEEFARSHNMLMTSIEKIISYRRNHEKLIQYVTSSKLPTKFGDFVQHVYRGKYDSDPHIAIVKGDILPESLRADKSGIDRPILLRVHSECFTGDTLGSLRCDCREQLHLALKKIEENGEGILLYMRQEGRGIGLTNKIKAYALQDKGLDTVEANEHLGFAADPRHYGVGAQILYDLGVRKIRILTNNPRKIAGLAGYGLSIEEHIPLRIKPRPENEKYLMTKKNRLDHKL